MFVEFIDGLLYKLAEVVVVLYRFGELYMLDERCPHAAIYRASKLIAIVEALTECLYLIAAFRETDNVVCSIVLEVKYELICYLSYVMPIIQAS